MGHLVRYFDTSAAKADAHFVGFVRGLKPPPPSVYRRHAADRWLYAGVETPVSLRRGFFRNLWRPVVRFSATCEALRARRPSGQPVWRPALRFSATRERCGV
jgi:hypothetical protein